eukprot:3261443-Amphidinium_carterae.1
MPPAAHASQLGAQLMVWFLRLPGVLRELQEMTFSGGTRTHRALLPISVEPFSVELRREIIRYGT